MALGIGLMKGPRGALFLMIEVPLYRRMLVSTYPPVGGFTLPLALPTGTKVDSGTNQRKSGTSVNFSNSGYLTQGGP